MASEAQIKAQRRKIRKFKAVAGITLKWVRNIVLAVLAVIITYLVVTAVHHEFLVNKEIEILKGARLYNLVEVEEDRFINVNVAGNLESKHTVVTISDLEVQDFTVHVQQMANNIGNYAKLALIDRAGYGHSDDTTSDQTIEQIISDYRIALQKTGVEGPYILLAHQFGGVYATYWAMQYPDEIEGIIYLDGTAIIESQSVENKPIDKDAVFSIITHKLGFQRMFYHDYYDNYPLVISSYATDYIRALNMHSVKTIAHFSELEHMGDNFQKAMDSIKENDIPKVYASIAGSFRTRDEIVDFFEYKNSQHEALEREPYYIFTGNDNDLSQAVSDFVQYSRNIYDNQTKPFIEAIGNCQFTKMPGDDKIYEHKPNAISDLIVDFIKYLDGEIEQVDEYYDDDIRSAWEDYLENKENQSTKPSQPTD
jgi:pimeloyl-ACP methyl ester carboxylesterase